MCVRGEWFCFLLFVCCLYFLYWDQNNYVVFKESFLPSKFWQLQNVEAQMVTDGMIPHVTWSHELCSLKWCKENREVAVSDLLWQNLHFFCQLKIPLMTKLSKAKNYYLQIRVVFLILCRHGSMSWALIMDGGLKDSLCWSLYTNVLNSKDIVRYFFVYM